MLLQHSRTMSILHLLRIATATFLCCLALPVCADIYSYTDSNGTPHFSNVPDDKRYAIYLRTQSDSPLTALLSQSGYRFNLANQKRFLPLIEEAARKFQIDAGLLHAVIAAESGYNPAAVSRKGATGLMQIMPDTARRYGVSNLYDPKQNIHGGAQYLRDLLQLFNNDTRLAVAAYNAGENAVIKYGNRIPPYRETIQYVPKVMAFYKQYQSKT